MKQKKITIKKIKTKFEDKKNQRRIKLKENFISMDYLK
jgi:hypothetical protein